MAGWGSSSAQGETAVTPIFDSGTLCVTCFLALFCCLGLGLRPGSVLPHLFVFPTHRLPFFVGLFFLPTLPRWRHMTPRRPRPTGSGLRLLCWWRSLLGILPHFTILLQ